MERIKVAEAEVDRGGQVCGLACNALSLNERKWVGRREKVVLGKEMEKGLVTVVVDAKVNQELVVR